MSEQDNAMSDAGPPQGAKAPGAAEGRDSLLPGGSELHEVRERGGLPYSHIRVVEFTHMVMGPTCGMVLADLGAEVIKVEPIGHGRQGDATRKLIGSGAGFFPMFNRNKKSLALDLETPGGKEAVLRLIATADVVTENFKPGTMKKLGLDYASLKTLNPRLIYVSHKGLFARPLRAPHRAGRGGADDGRPGLHDGPPRRPAARGHQCERHHGRHVWRHGVMAALAQRDKTGLGQEVQSALFENNVFLVAQHMMQFAVTGKAADPMPARISAWAVYDVFKVKDDEQIFLAVVSDTAWAVFCDAFGFADLKNDARLTNNNARVRAREWMMPILRDRLVAFSAAELAATFEKHALPFAPITRPQDL
jgi:crotonobetainyl-CoA:carnitine CoA-transferase CaiB-like acyl-CoA transferase